MKFPFSHLTHSFDQQMAVFTPCYYVHLGWHTEGKINNNCLRTLIDGLTDEINWYHR